MKTLVKLYPLIHYYIAYLCIFIFIVVEGFTRISALRWWILDRRMSALPRLNQFYATLCHFAMQLDALKFRFLCTLHTLPQIIFYAKSFDVFGVTRLYAEVTQKCSEFINVNVHCTHSVAVTSLSVMPFSASVVSPPVTITKGSFSSSRFTSLSVRLSLDYYYFFKYD